MATILVADDDPAVLRMIAILLEKEGHKTIRASNGLEALLVYQSYAPQIDLLLTDIDMPEMNGMELAARIHATHPSAAIVLMSGAAPVGGVAVPGSFPIVKKPFQKAILLAAVQEACPRQP